MNCCNENSNCCSGAGKPAEEQAANDQPVLLLTESAATQIKSMRESQPEEKGKALRVYVEGGGCSGLQYGMVFDEARQDDLAVEHHGMPVIIDPVSANYLRGATIDFSDALNGGGFKISNPNAHHSCGCGKSFEA